MGEVATSAIYNDQGVQIGVRNVPLPGHALYPGWVERRIVSKDGQYHIVTTGGGSGRWGGVNVAVDEWVWGDLDELVAEKLRSGKR